MKNFIDHLSRGYQKFRGSIFSALVLLFLVRIFAVLLNVPRNFGELVRPDLFFPDYGFWLQATLYLLLFLSYFLSVRKYSEDFQYKSALIYPACFILLALSNLKLGNKAALYRIFEAQALWEDLTAVLTMDLFFQPPFIFWALGWYALVFYLAKRSGKVRWIDLFCLAPLLQFDYPVGNFQLIFAVCIFLLTILATRLAKGRSAEFFHYYLGVTFTLAIFYLSNFAIVYRASLLTALLIMFLIWLVGFRFIRYCQSQPLASANQHSWFFLLFVAYSLSFLITKIPMGYAIFHFWFLLSSLSYVFLSVAHLAIITLIALLCGFLHAKLEKPVFGLLLITSIVYYIVDAFVFLKLGQRLDYHGINWVLGLSRLNLFLETAQGMLSWKNITGLFGLPLFLLLFYRRLSKISTQNPARRPGFLPAAFLIIAISSFVGTRLLCMPINVLADPIQKFFKTVPYFDKLFALKPDLAKVKNGLAENGFDIEKSTRAFIEAQEKLPERKPQNLILITLESTGSQYLSLFGSADMTMPNLETLKSRIEIFPFYFSTFPESANAEFSIFSSLMSSNFHVFRHKPNFVGNTIIEILKAAGFDCSLYFCIYTGNTGILSFFAPRGADRLYDATSMPGMTREDGWIWGLKEHFVADKIAAKLLEKKDKDQPFFIYFRTAFPHAPFDPIDGSEPVFAKGVKQHTDRIARFKDCILYIDKQIFKIVKALDQSGLASDTQIIITSDHVTNLGEDGRVGHGWNLEPRLANVPLIIIHPESHGFKINRNAGSHIDMLPTALNLIGARNSLPLAIQGLDLRGEIPDDRQIFISSFNHLALVDKGIYYWYRQAINNTRALKIDFTDGRISYRQISMPPALLKAKAEKMKEIADLQGKLIMNYDTYFDKLSLAPKNQN